MTPPLSKIYIYIYFQRLQFTSHVFIVVEAKVPLNNGCPRRTTCGTPQGSIKKMEGGFKHFAATPVLTSPPFHRYARKLVPGQSCLEDDAFSSPSIAPMGPDTAVERFYHRRNKDWPANLPSWTVTKNKAWQGMPKLPPRKYLDERHCEVQVLGTLMREVIYAANNKGASHDGTYDVELEPAVSPHIIGILEQVSLRESDAKSGSY